jgi:hypothetical protein
MWMLLPAIVPAWHWIFCAGVEYSRRGNASISFDNIRRPEQVKTQKEDSQFTTAD